MVFSCSSSLEKQSLRLFGVFSWPSFWANLRVFALEKSLATLEKQVFQICSAITSKATFNEDGIRYPLGNGPESAALGYLVVLIYFQGRAFDPCHSHMIRIIFGLVFAFEDQHYLHNARDEGLQACMRALRQCVSDVRPNCSHNMSPHSENTHTQKLLLLDQKHFDGIKPLI